MHTSNPFVRQENFSKILFFSLMFHVLMIMKLSSFAINKIYSSEFEDLCKESFLCLQNEMILLESQPVGAA